MNVRQSQFSWEIATVAIANRRQVLLLQLRFSSRASRGFCPICGSRLFSKPPVPELMGITAGSLDDPSWFQPMIDFYTATAQPWDYMNPDLPKFAKLPPPRNL
jgi:hypothetical protein